MGWLPHPPEIPTQLLLTYGYFPDNFTDGELNIPGSGNGLPDILDEASWLPRFLQRLRAETMAKGWSTGGVGGARVMGDLWGTDADAEGNGRGSWQDTDRDWYVSGEDVPTTFAYAGMAAQLAHFLGELGQDDPEGVDWRAEATSAYDWAEARYDASLSCQGIAAAEKKNYAAAALYQLTAEDGYDTAFADSWGEMNTTDGLAEDAGFGAYVYLSLLESQRSQAISEEAWANIEGFGDFILLGPTDRRAARYGGNPWFPMLVGQGTTPMVFEAVMVYGLLRGRDADKAGRYLAALQTTADYFLGNNPLNMTWVTGLGERSPERLFHLDFWYDDHEGIPEGFVPYGPWRRMPGFANAGPWDLHWPESSVYPAIDAWPGHERWFGQQTSPLTAEFTVHQNIVAGATLYGALAGGADCRGLVSTTSPTGVGDLGVTVFPNPGDGLLSLQGLGAAGVKQIYLYGAGGRLLRQLPVREVLDISDLPSGLYVLSLEGDRGRQVSRVVIR